MGSTTSKGLFFLATEFKLGYMFLIQSLTSYFFFFLQDEETEALLSADFEIGHFFRERVIPKVINFFNWLSSV